jgi:hypothetical protein
MSGVQQSEFSLDASGGTTSIKPTLVKFDLFKKSMFDNDHISKALLCRRFSMVKCKRVSLCLIE